MDFLRRLAPPRATDATRAAALLPSRFASTSPLRERLGDSRPARGNVEDDASLLFDETDSFGVTNTSAAQRHAMSGDQPSQSTPRPLGIEPALRDRGGTSPHASVKSPDPAIPDPSALQRLKGAALGRASPASPELNDLVAALAASPGPPGVAAPPGPARVTLPLSQAALAQRTLPSQDDGQVVHVTIGRIDVVASTAPAPVARRSPTPREPRVTLSDYLRGDNGGRR
jgi:hypothetical protein